MPDQFDPYREALVMEMATEWSAEYDHLDESEKDRISGSLHADPENAAILEYVRTHTGFCRKITVTDADLQRVAS